VAQLAAGPMGAGEHRIPWAREGTMGRSAPGLYFARAMVGGRTLVTRILLLP
jgi:hypothetical protein